MIADHIMDSLPAIANARAVMPNIPGAPITTLTITGIDVIKCRVYGSSPRNSSIPASGYPNWPGTRGRLPGTLREGDILRIPFLRCGCVIA